MEVEFMASQAQRMLEYAEQLTKEDNPLADSEIFFHPWDQVKARLFRGPKRERPFITSFAFRTLIGRAIVEGDVEFLWQTLNEANYSGAVSLAPELIELAQRAVRFFETPQPPD